MRQRDVAYSLLAVTRVKFTLSQLLFGAVAQLAEADLAHGNFNDRRLQQQGR